MAIVNVLGNLLTNTYGIPSSLNGSGTDIGEILLNIASAPIATTDSIGSTYRFAQVRSSDIIRDLKFSSTALTAGAISLGLYLPNTGAVVSVALFATSINCASAVTQVDERFTSLAITTIGKRVWQLLGLSADPVLVYDLCGTSTTAATAAGTLSVDLTYVR